MSNMKILKMQMQIRTTRQKQINLRSFDLDKIQALPLKSGEDEEEEGLSEDSGDDLDEDIPNSMDGDWDVDVGDAEPLHILPLYSMLPSNEQQKVFETPPGGCRLCVVATNVAETSLTIPSIRYVVDTGKVKTKDWDKLTGVQQFRVTWCSKASAEQRAGRAGRTGPGHCYRLYSSAVFDSDFDQYSPPEILIRPVDDMMLFMKSIGIDRVCNFPYPTHPGDTQLLSAEQTLLNLGALEVGKGNEAKNKPKAISDQSNITDLGKTMANFPLSPRFSKMLALSFHHSVVEYTVALVAALTVQEVFLEVSLHDSSKKVKSSWTKLRRQWAGTGSQFLLGDCMILLRAVGAFEYEGGTAEFCQKTGLRMKAMNEIRKLRKQLTSEINMMVPPSQELPLNPQMKPPSEDEATLLRQILLSWLPDRVARKLHESELKNDEDKRKFKYAYRCADLEDSVIMHASSILRSYIPEWVVYQEIFESNGKMCMRGITAIEPVWIPSFCKTLCTTGSPLEEPPPYFDSTKGIIKCAVKCSYGKQRWELPVCHIEYPFSIEKFKLFAKFLMDGTIFPGLSKWTPHLLSLPITMTKPWARLQPRTQKLLDALTKERICNKAELLNLWKSDKNYLLEEYLSWLPADHHVQVTSCWPPVSDC